MERFIIQPGVAITVLDFIKEFSSTFINLVSLVWLIATIIATIALRRYGLEKLRQVPREYVSGD